MGKRFFKTEEERRAYQLGIQDGRRMKQELSVNDADFLEVQRKIAARKAHSTVIWDMERKDKNEGKPTGTN